MASSLNNLAVTVQAYWPIKQGRAAHPAEPHDPRVPDSGRIIPTWRISLNDLAESVLQIWANTLRPNCSTSGASRSMSPSSGRIIPDVVEYGLHSLALLHAATESLVQGNGRN